jgi:hypothetical protein
VELGSPESEWRLPSSETVELVVPPVASPLPNHALPIPAMPPIPPPGTPLRVMESPPPPVVVVDPLVTLVPGAPDPLLHRREEPLRMREPRLEGPGEGGAARMGVRDSRIWEVRLEVDAGAGVIEGVVVEVSGGGGGGGGVEGVEGVGFGPEGVVVLSESVYAGFGGGLDGGAGAVFVSSLEVIRSCEGSDSVVEGSVEVERPLIGFTRGGLVARGLGALADPLRLLFALEGLKVLLLLLPLTGGLALRPRVVEAAPPLPLYRLFPARPVPNLFANSWDAGMGGG